MRTYGELHFKPENELWVIDKLEPHVAIRLKQLFPRIPKASPGPYKLRHDLSTAADLNWFLQRYPLAANDADLQQLWSAADGFVQRVSELETILQPDYAPSLYAGLQPGMALRHYQGQAVDVLRIRLSLMLGDVVGLGKTYSACGAMLLPEALPAIVVCLPHLQEQWHGVVESFTTLQAYSVTTTRPHELPNRDVYIFRYTQLPGWVNFFRQFSPGLVAWDEIQELRRGTEAQKGIASMHLAELARYRLGLSATPIYNYGTEIFNVMEFIERGILGSRDEFMREWTDGKLLKDPTALGTFLREQHVFLRRTREEVGMDLPKVNKVVEIVDYDAKAVKSAEDLAHQLAIKATTATFTERGKAVRELDMLMRHTTGVAKAPYVADLVRIIVESGEPVLLVGWHREVYDIWNERLADLKPAMYTGSESAAQKKREMNRFLAGETEVLIMSLRSGAGVDGLQERCSVAVHGELDWSSKIHDQVNGRLNRDGMDVDKAVTAIYAVTNDGSDPAIMEVIGLKAADSEPVIDPGLGFEEAAGSTEGESHLQRLVQKYLKKRHKS